MAIQAAPLIIGSGGQVGRSLVSLLHSKNYEFHISTRKDHNSPLYLDLENITTIPKALDTYSRAIKGPGIVFLTGAYTHVDGCEQNPDRAWKINAEAPGIIAQECARLGHHLVFFSTEYVFGEAEYLDGSIGPFSEEDTVAPSSVYGKTKVEAENIILSLRDSLSYTIIRTTIVFSWKMDDMNFPMQLYRFLRDKEEGKRFRIPVDQISTPTFAKPLAEASYLLGLEKTCGIFHLAGSDLVSRSDFALQLIKLFGFSREEALKRIDFFRTSDLRQLARRPLSAGLKTTKAQARKLPIWSLAQAFQEFPREWVTF